MDAEEQCRLAAARDTEHRDPLRVDLRLTVEPAKRPLEVLERDVLEVRRQARRIEIAESERRDPRGSGDAGEQRIAGATFGAAELEQRGPRLTANRVDEGAEDAVLGNGQLADCERLAG